MQERRVRRARDKDEILERLTSRDEGIFENYRDALGFAAALGIAQDRQAPIGRTSEAIAWQVFSNNSGNEDLVDMIGLVELQGMVSLDADHFDDRLKLFEEYANGGLEIISERINKSGRQANAVILDLIMDAETRSEEPATLDSIAEELAL